MGKKVTNARREHGNSKGKQPHSNHKPPLFFNSKPISSTSEIKEPPKTQEVRQAVQEISVQTTTDVLLAAILQELKTQNMIELMKLKVQQEQEQEQEELQTAEKIQEHDNARFDEIRTSMYS